MPRFSYQAYNSNKERQDGIIDAENRAQAFEKLNRLSLYPLKITPLDETEVARFMSKSFARVHAADVVVLTRQVSDLLEAGLTILSALLLVSKQAWRPALKNVVEALINDLKEGRTFSAALSNHPAVFSKVYVALVRSSEAGGFLKEAMARIADFMEEEEAFKSKIRSAMVYPAFIAIVGIATVYVLLSFVIPKLVVVFQDFGQELPLPTQILIAVSNTVSAFWWLAVLIVVLAIFVWARVLKTTEGRLFFDRLLLRAPVVGQLMLKTQMERFARILSTLLGNGVTILPSLEIIRDIVDNKVLQNEIDQIRLKVRDGAPLSKAVGQSHYFPVAIVNIAAVGEESGSLEKVLRKVSETYAKEVDRALKTFISLLEPAMILVMGFIVACIVIAMLLPIFEINFLAQ